MYNNDTVLLLDDGNRRSFECGEQTALGIEISHYGNEPLNKPLLRWQLVNGQKMIDDGSTELESIPCGTLTQSFNTKLKMPPGADPARFELRAALSDNGTEICRKPLADLGDARDTR